MAKKFDVQTLAVKDGLSATVHSMGARLVSLRVPSASGTIETLLAYPNSDTYVDDRYFVGATVGRYANRLRGAKVNIDGIKYDLDSNETSTGHCLHGGSDGFHRQLWALESADAGKRITCRHQSADGVQGFPGNVEIVVTYQILNRMSLAIDFEARSDAVTVLSLANHAYFNLNGHYGTINNHELTLHADDYTPVDESLIPTGEIAAVDNTRFDFRKPRQLTSALGVYDINYVVGAVNDGPRLVAELYSPASELRLRVSTTQPGLQLYTGDYLDKPFLPRQGVCLEAQNFPNSPNEAGFPSARLAPGELYCHRSIYEFS